MRQDYKENPEEYTILYESHPDDPPEELKDIKRDYDKSFTIPHHLKEKTGSSPKAN